MPFSLRVVLCCVRFPSGREKHQTRLLVAELPLQVCVGWCTIIWYLLQGMNYSVEEVIIEERLRTRLTN